jgi:hypothetical protein
MGLLAAVVVWWAVPGVQAGRAGCRVVPPLPSRASRAGCGPPGAGLQANMAVLFRSPPPGTTVPPSPQGVRRCRPGVGCGVSC